LPHDQPALPMNGLQEWPDAKALRDFGKAFCQLDDETVTEVFSDTLIALEAAPDMLDALKEKYPDVTELDHLCEVVSRSVEMLREDPMVREMENETEDALPNEEAALAELEMACHADELSRIS
ncbi:MAG: hypothetical protein ACYCR3_10035, partial [Acidithiobacillus sp.]